MSAGYGGTGALKENAKIRTVENKPPYIFVDEEDTYGHNTGIVGTPIFSIGFGKYYNRKRYLTLSIEFSTRNSPDNYKINKFSFAISGNL